MAPRNKKNSKKRGNNAETVAVHDDNEIDLDDIDAVTEHQKVSGARKSDDYEIEANEDERKINQTRTGKGSNKQTKRKNSSSNNNNNKKTQPAKSKKNTKKTTARKKRSLDRYSTDIHEYEESSSSSSDEDDACWCPPVPPAPPDIQDGGEIDLDDVNSDEEISLVETGNLKDDSEDTEEIDNMGGDDEEEDDWFDENCSPKGYSELFYMFENSEWTKMIRYLKTKKGKEDARLGIPYEDTGEESKRLILHWAIETMAPVRVIRALINAFPDSIRKTNVSYEFPIHILFADEASSNYASLSSSRDHSTPLEVLHVLLSHYPEVGRKKSRSKGTPLHYACDQARKVEPACIRRLLEAHPAGVKQKASFGYGGLQLPNFLPVHFACATFAPKEILQILVDAFPESLRERSGRQGEDKPCDVDDDDYYDYDDDYDRHPLEIALPVELYVRLHYSFLVRGHTRKALPFQDDDEDDNKEEDIPKETKKQISAIIYLLCATFPNISPIKPELFHSDFVSRVPLMESIESTPSTKKRRSPRIRATTQTGTSTSCCNEETFLILHYAILCGARNGVLNTILSGDKHRQRDMLLKKNVHGRMPILCAIESMNVNGALFLEEKYRWNDEVENESLDVLSIIHGAIANYGKYDDRQNDLIYKLFHYLPKKKNGTTETISLNPTDRSDKQHQAPSPPSLSLQLYLHKLISTPDAYPKLGCGGSVYLCPVIVKKLLLRNPSVAELPLDCQTMRYGYHLLRATNTERGSVTLYPFQLLSVLVSDATMSETVEDRQYNDDDDIPEMLPLFRSDEEYNDYHSQKYDKESEIDRERKYQLYRSRQSKDFKDCVVVDALYEMLRLYPAAIEDCVLCK